MHAIDHSKGRAAYFGVGKSAWHQLGPTLAEAPKTTDEALALAGADYEVLLEQVTRTRSDGSVWNVDGQYFVVRSDTDAELGIVGSRYRVLQNSEAYKVAQPLLDAGLAEIETGGVLNDGADVWLLVRFTLSDEITAGLSADGRDPVAPYALITNNHTGRASIQMLLTPIRVVCWNTLSLALRGNTPRVKVPHTGNVEAKVARGAAELFRGVEDGYAKAASLFTSMRTAEFTEQQFNAAVLDAILPLPTYAGGDDLSSRQETTVERTQERRDEIRRLWDEGDGHTGDHSAWEAYQAVTQAVDHNREIFPVRQGLASSLMTGALADVKKTALNSIVNAMAENRGAQVLNSIVGL